MEKNHGRVVAGVGVARAIACRLLDDAVDFLATTEDFLQPHNTGAAEREQAGRDCDGDGGDVQRGGSGTLPSSLCSGAMPVRWMARPLCQRRAKCSHKRPHAGVQYAGWRRPARTRSCG